MGKNDRFQIIYTQGITDITRILLDTRTGASLPCWTARAGP